MDTTVLVAIVSASSVLLGAAISLGSAMIQSQLDRKHKREILLRTKYEELGFHFLASTEMPGRLLNCTTDEEILAVTHQKDANRAALLALIYFSELREPIQRYVASYQNLCDVAAGLYYAKPQTKSVGLVVNGLPAYRTASQSYMDEHQNVVSKLEGYAPKYTKS